MITEKCDMSGTCRFKYDEYWMQVDHYHTMSQDKWNKWYREHCAKCTHMCEICMYGED